MIPENTDAAFCDLKILPPAPVVLHQQYAMAAIQQWGKESSRVIIEEYERAKIMPPPRISASLAYKRSFQTYQGEPRSSWIGRRDAQEEAAVKKRRREDDEGQSGRGSQVSSEGPTKKRQELDNDGDSDENHDPDWLLRKTMMILGWVSGRAPAVIARHNELETEQMDRVERWRTGLLDADKN